MTRSGAARCTSTTAGSGNDISGVVNLDENLDMESNKNNRMRRHEEINNASVDEEVKQSRRRTILEPHEQNTINAKN